MSARRITMPFYTYVHHRKTDGVPFYIGKGKGDRAYRKSDRNPYWHKVAKKHGFEVLIAANWATESEAFEHEKFLIQCFRGMGYKLVNITDGGEGVSGWTPSEETRKKISAAKQGRKNGCSGRQASDATRGKISAALAGVAWTDEKRRAHSAVLKNSEAAKANAQRIKDRTARSRVPVMCIETGREFATALDAAHWLRSAVNANALSQPIYRACHPGYKTRSAYGYTWKFV